MMNRLWDSIMDLVSPKKPMTPEQILENLEMKEQDLEKRAQLLERIAASAEKEANLRLKIAEANKRIKVSKPRNKWLPLIIGVAIILFLILLAQTC